MFTLAATGSIEQDYIDDEPTKDDFPAQFPASICLLAVFEWRRTVTRTGARHLPDLAQWNLRSLSQIEYGPIVYIVTLPWDLSTCPSPSPLSPTTPRSPIFSPCLLTTTPVVEESERDVGPATSSYHY